MAQVDNEFYDDLHGDWWSDHHFMALLRHAINPPRFEYFRQVLARRAEPAQALRVLDVGCGGGLLAEEFARLGCNVTGVDPSVATLQVADEHAKAQGLDILYLRGCGEMLPVDDVQFDVVCCCDVLEHVEDVEQVLREIARVLKPGGVLFFDTINRTLRSKLVTIHLAQECRLTRILPRDVHVWAQYIKPQELQVGLSRNGLGRAEFVGLCPTGNPLSALWALLRHKAGRLSFAGLGKALRVGAHRDLSISYMGYAVRT